MELSKKEKAVIEAMRKGATVKVLLHKTKSVHEVDEIMNLFSRIEVVDSYISEEQVKGKFGGRRYIIFNKRFKKLEVSCFMNLDEKND